MVVKKEPDDDVILVDHSTASANKRKLNLNDSADARVSPLPKRPKMKTESPSIPSQPFEANNTQKQLMDILSVMHGGVSRQRQSPTDTTTFQRPLSSQPSTTNRNVSVSPNPSQSGRHPSGSDGSQHLGRVQIKADLDALDNVDDSGNASSLSCADLDRGPARLSPPPSAAVSLNAPTPPSLPDRRPVLPAPSPIGSIPSSSGSVCPSSCEPNPSFSPIVVRRDIPDDDTQEKYNSSFSINASNRLSKNCEFQCRRCDFKERRIHLAIRHLVEHHQLPFYSVNKQLSGFFQGQKVRMGYDK